MIRDEDSFEVGRTLADLLARANFLLTEEFHERLRGHGLTVTEWRVLAALSARDGSAMTDLAAFLLFKQPTLTKAIDRMEEAGLVERRTPAADRRRTLVHITAAGRAVVGPLLSEARQHDEAMRRRCGLDASRRLVAQLEEMIERLAGAANQRHPAIVEEASAGGEERR
jgi:MarR family transcriptional regulator, organic hydroperoxide resistance regulator